MTSLLRHSAMGGAGRLPIPAALLTWLGGWSLFSNVRAHLPGALRCALVIVERLGGLLVCSAAM